MFTFVTSMVGQNGGNVMNVMRGGGVHVTSDVIFTRLGVLFACFCLRFFVSSLRKPRKGVLLFVFSFVIVDTKYTFFMYKLLVIKVRI